MALLVRTRVWRLGTDRWMDGEMEAIRLFASSSAFSRRSRGRLARALMELSVKSIQSCWSYIACKMGYRDIREYVLV